MFIMIFNFILYYFVLFYFVLRFFLSFSYSLIPSQLFLMYLASFRGPWFTASSGNPEILNFYAISVVFHISELLETAIYMLTENPVLLSFVS